ncbi:uncharacterized protein DSM5745_05987 [Aspergillus mulundensis]|uniref:Uncharacterized protein n=1 Tax=Aspergillus mulundensis TaxID=1810919 RepID=A0A3D8RYL9_9EURO|nr:hypothetical protein DSM5745_05987 [Aspergillus mulundensis]RDW79135.1 hypothetical protein DSM5745_05987 [Aspergillus mulundensis]
MPYTTNVVHPVSRLSTLQNVGEKAMPSSLSNVENEAEMEMEMDTNMDGELDTEIPSTQEEKNDQTNQDGGGARYQWFEYRMEGVRVDWGEFMSTELEEPGSEFEGMGEDEGGEDEESDAEMGKQDEERDGNDTDGGSEKSEGHAHTGDECAVCEDCEEDGAGTASWDEVKGDSKEGDITVEKVCADEDDSEEDEPMSDGTQAVHWEMEDPPSPLPEGDREYFADGVMQGQNHQPVSIIPILPSTMPSNHHADTDTGPLPSYIKLQESHPPSVPKHLSHLDTITLKASLLSLLPGPYFLSLPPVRESMHQQSKESILALLSTHLDLHQARAQKYESRKTAIRLYHPDATKKALIREFLDGRAESSGFEPFDVIEGLGGHSMAKLCGLLTAALRAEGLSTPELYRILVEPGVEYPLLAVMELFGAAVVLWREGGEGENGMWWET